MCPSPPPLYNYIGIFNCVKEAQIHSSKGSETTPKLLLTALCLGLLLCSCGGTDVAPSTRFSLEELQEDFHRLRRLIADHHPKTFTDWRELDSAFDQQYELLSDDMTALEFRRIIAPAVSKVRCGHTRLLFPDALYEDLRKSASHLPFDIRIISDSLFVLEAYGDEPAIPLGSRIVSINGRSASELARTIRSCLPADGQNTSYKDFRVNGNFRSNYFTFVESPERFEIVFRAPDASEDITVTVLPLTPEAIWRLTEDERSSDLIEDATERSFDTEGRYAVLTVRFFEYHDDMGRFVDLIDRFFEEARSRGTKSLILDLRGNDGGDPHSSAYLLTYLIGKPFRYFAARSAWSYDELKDIQHPPDNPFMGDLYVLVDGGSYSTTGHFCSLLRYHEVGVFIGEETGGSFICHGGYKEESLGHTGTSLLLPHTVYKTDVQDLPLGQGLLPDHFVRPSIQDLLEDRDPVFDRAVALIDSAMTANDDQ